MVLIMQTKLICLHPQISVFNGGKLNQENCDLITIIQLSYSELVWSSRHTSGSWLHAEVQVVFVYRLDEFNIW